MWCATGVSGTEGTPVEWDLHPRKPESPCTTKSNKRQWGQREGEAAGLKGFGDVNVKLCESSSLDFAPVCGAAVALLDGLMSYAK